MNTEPTRCVYEQTAHGRCFRPTMDESGLCVYHTPKALAARKPRRLSRKKLQAAHDRFKAALERINNIRVQDQSIVDAWKEARQIAFDAFDAS